MNNEEAARYALASGSCPECGHGILCHQRGICRVARQHSRITHKGKPALVDCGCTYIQPPNSQGTQSRLGL